MTANAIVDADGPRGTGSPRTRERPWFRRVRLRRVSLRRALTFLGLVAAWCALWGSITVANVAAGSVVALMAMRVGVGGSGDGGVRLVPLVRLTGLVAADMVRSTIAVIREVATPTDYTDEGVIAVPIPAASKHHLLLLFVAITVTPGTAVVAAESDGSVLYLHVLHCDRRESIEEHVLQLAELANAALPVGENREAVDLREGSGR